MAKIGVVQINGVAVTAFVLSIVVGALLSRTIHHLAPIVVGALLGLYLLYAIKVVQQWERVALLRLGRYVGLRGPGIFHIIPVVETLSPFCGPTHSGG
jgi:regulator of protease activity HflC (stomatin/prohibitin superfamily)